MLHIRFDPTPQATPLPNYFILEGITAFNESLKMILQAVIPQN